MKRSFFLLCAVLLSAFTVCAEEASTNALNITFDEVAPSLVIIEYELGGESCKASGIIVEMSGTSYLLTSQHVLLGAERPRFTSALGRRLNPVKVEISAGRDLVRLELKDPPPALPCSPEAKMNMPVALLTAVSSEDEGINNGEIIGMGGTKIEVSTAFGDEDNGAPVINEDRVVVGIATYNKETMKHAMVIGTRFEDATRYFCSRVSPTGWQAVNWSSYNRKFGRPYQKHRLFAEEVIQTLKNRERNGLNARRAAELSTACRTHARQVEKLMEQRGLSGFLRNAFTEQSEIFTFAEKWFSNYAKARN